MIERWTGAGFAGLDRTTRAWLVGLLLLLLAGLGGAEAMRLTHLGATLEAERTHFLGSAGGLSYPRELPELTESLHFHAFAFPLVWTLAGALFLRARCPTWLRAVVLTSGAPFMLLHLAAPFAVRYLGGGWIWLFALSGLGMMATLGIATLVPLWQLLRPGSGGP